MSKVNAEWKVILIADGPHDGGYYVIAEASGGWTNTFGIRNTASGRDFKKAIEKKRRFTAILECNDE